MLAHIVPGAGAFQPAALQAPANDAHKIVALLQGTTGRDAGLSHRPKSSPAQQPWRRQRRTAAAGHCALTLITRTRDPFERSISACEQTSSSISATSISVVGSHCKVLGISPGQMRHAEPSLSSTRWLLSCFLICIADLPCEAVAKQHQTKTAVRQTRFQLIEQSWHVEKTCHMEQYRGFG